MATHARDKIPKTLSKVELLPQEIINDIATSCDADSVIAFSSTCRLLHRICYTWSVFKQIVLYAVAAELQTRDCDITRKDAYRTINFKYDRLSDLLGQDRKKWIAYALALGRAVALENKLSATQASSATETPHALLDADKLHEYLSYMPQLLCLGYQPLKEAHIAIDTFYELMTDPNDLGYWLRDPTSLDRSHQISENGLIFCVLFEARQSTYREGQERDPTERKIFCMGLNFQTIRDPHPFKTVHTFTRLASTWQEARRSPPPDLYQFPWVHTCPCWMEPLRWLPFSPVLKPYPLLDEEAVDRSIMSSIFVDKEGEASEWQGYHVFGRRRFDLHASVLRNLKLKLEYDDKKRIYKLSAAGVQILNGAPRSTYIRYTATGECTIFDKQISVFLRFFEQDKLDLELEGSLTPFGIIGTARSRAVDGHFWLWKKSWCELPVAPR